MKLVFCALLSALWAAAVSAGPSATLPAAQPVPAALWSDGLQESEAWIAPGMALPAIAREAVRAGALPDAYDPSFAERRWPQILKSAQWARKLARTRIPAKADTLMPRLKAIFIEEGVPPELAWIAEVESTLNPRAVSATGARGLFQFTSVTAERFGLLTAAADDRAVPEKSARAAARYLAFLYERFGSWHLALAGYNAGEGCVGRLLQEHQATTFQEIASYLPAATQVYVPKVMATVALRERTWLGALPSPSVTPTAN